MLLLAYTEPAPLSWRACPLCGCGARPASVSKCVDERLRPRSQPCGKIRLGVPCRRGQL